MDFSNKHSVMRFAIPIGLENIATTLIGLVFSSIIGGISGSSLAAVGLVNTLQSVLTSMCACITTGSASLTARLVGAGDAKEASRTVEQALFLSLVIGGSAMLLCEVTAVPVMHLLLPNAEADVIAEGLAYYRILMLTFPIMIGYNVLVGALRASGESRLPMVGAIGLNLVQIASAYVFISRLGLSVTGAGLAYGTCRIFGFVLLLWFCMRGHRFFALRLRSMLRPQGDMLKRILKLGLPTSCESTSVQIAYLLANSMAMGLGTMQASLYQIFNTVLTIPSLPQTIGNTMVVAVVGQQIGAKAYEGAQKSRLRILLITLASCLLLCVAVAAIGEPIMGWYTKDAEVRKESAKIAWLMVAHLFVTVPININDPVLHVGGDVRCVMWYTIACVWAIRLPLTLLFCYALDMGAVGVLLANIISLAGREIFGIVRIRQKKWLTMRV